MIRIAHPEGYQPCAGCGNMGYTDERSYTDTGYICARCANPHLDWEEEAIE